jgi:pilus assembly protein CpaE
MREMARAVSRRHAARQQRAFEESGERDDGGRAPGVITALFATRGGAGVSTIATNVAVALAHRAPDRVVLVDLNVRFGHVPVLLDLSPRTSLSSISTVSLRQMDRESLGFYLTTHPESSLRVLPAALQPDDADQVSGEHVSAVLEVLRREFQYVVLDVGRGFSEVTLAAIERSANIMQVCTPDRLGAHGVAECQRIFGDLLRLPLGGLHYVLNHPVPHASFSAEAFEQALGVRLVETIPFGGQVPMRAALEGHPIVTRWAGSPVGKSLLGLAARLEQQAAEIGLREVQATAVSG